MHKLIWRQLLYPFHLISDDESWGWVTPTSCSCPTRGCLGSNVLHVWLCGDTRTLFFQECRAKPWWKSSNYDEWWHILIYIYILYVLYVIVTYAICYIIFCCVLFSSLMLCSVVLCCGMVWCGVVRNGMVWYDYDNIIYVCLCMIAYDYVWLCKIHYV